MAGQNPLGTLYAANSSNALIPVHANKLGELHVSESGRSVFIGANPSAVTTSAALATTYVGLCLSNPAANTFNLAVRYVSGMIIVAPGAVLGFNLITGFVAGGVTAHTTALTPFSALIGSGTAATGKVDSACTLVGTPIWTMPLISTPVSAQLPSFNIDLKGSIAIPPGGYIAIGTTVAGPTSGFQGAIVWEEIPV